MPNLYNKNRESVDLPGRFYNKIKDMFSVDKSGILNRTGCVLSAVLTSLSSVLQGDQLNMAPLILEKLSTILECLLSQAKILT